MHDALQGKLGEVGRAYQYAAGGTPQAPPTEEIPGEIQRLEQTLGTLDGLVNHLYSRIESVLSPEVPTPTTAEKNIAPPLGTRLAASIYELTLATRAIAQKLDAICSRVRL